MLSDSTGSSPFASVILHDGARLDVRYRSLPLLTEMADGFGAPRYGLAFYCGPSPFSCCEKWAYLQAGFPLFLLCVGPLVDRYLFFSTYLPLRSILFTSVARLDLMDLPQSYNIQRDLNKKA